MKRTKCSHSSTLFPISITLLLNLLLTLSPHPIDALGRGDNNLIEHICSRTLKRDDCIASLATNQDSQVATLPQLGIIALKIAGENATETSLYIKRMLTNQTLDPAVEQALHDCFQEYLDAVDQLDDSLAALLANATQDVKTWVSAAMADAESCDEDLKENEGLDSVLSKRNAAFRQLCSTVLAINSLLAETL